MKKYWKHILFGLVLGLLISACWMYCHIEAYCFFCPSIDTVYAPGYSEEDFNRIQVNMTMDEVSNIMCAPLINYTYPNGKIHVSYTEDGKCKFGDFAWFGRSIWVSNGIVVNVDSRIYYD